MRQPAGLPTFQPMLRFWLHVLLCLTLLSTAVASAWACPQLAGLWSAAPVADSSCPHHRDPQMPEAPDGIDPLPGLSQCCCPAPLPPALAIATLAVLPSSDPPRRDAVLPPAPLINPPLRPPAALHA